MRNFKIGVMTDSFRTSFVDALDKAKELGAQGVQMYVTEGDMFYKNLTDERIEQAKREYAVISVAMASNPKRKTSGKSPPASWWQIWPSVSVRR